MSLFDNHDDHNHLWRNLFWLSVLTSTSSRNDAPAPEVPFGCCGVIVFPFLAGMLHLFFDWTWAAAILLGMGMIASLYSLSDAFSSLFGKHKNSVMVVLLPLVLFGVPALEVHFFTSLPWLSTKKTLVGSLVSALSTPIGQDRGKPPPCPNSWLQYSTLVPQNLSNRVSGCVR